MLDLALLLPNELQAAELAALQPVNGSALAASTDAERISAWLIARGQRSANTFRAYRKEAARLLVWLHEQGMQLIDMKVEHTIQFYDLLRNPPERWLRPRKVKKGETLLATQLLINGLDENSVAYSRKVLGQMFNYLIKAGHAQFNVFELSPQLVVAPTPVVERILDVEGWVWLWHWIIGMARETQREYAHAVRARWVFALLYHTGMRREEIAKGLMSHFIRLEGQWRLRVFGKRGKVRFITINSVLLDELLVYRRAMDADTDYPSPNESMPLVMSVNLGRIDECMTPRAIGMIVGSTCKMAAQACDDEHIRGRLESMSTHWLRHTNATHRRLAGASTETNQQELGHEDIKTTMIYEHIFDDERAKDAEKFARFARTNQDEQ